GKHSVMMATQDVDEGLTRTAGHDVPKGDVQGAHRCHDGPTPPMLGRLLVELLPDPVDGRRVLGGRERKEFLGDDRRCHRRWSTPDGRLAPTDETFRGVEPYPHGFARSDVVPGVGELRYLGHKGEDLYRRDAIWRHPRTSTGCPDA